MLQYCLCCCCWLYSDFFFPLFVSKYCSLVSFSRLKTFSFFLSFLKFLDTWYFLSFCVFLAEAIKMFCFIWHCHSCQHRKKWVYFYLFDLINFSLINHNTLLFFIHLWLKILQFPRQLFSRNKSSLTFICMPHNQRIWSQQSSSIVFHPFRILSRLLLAMSSSCYVDIWQVAAREKKVSVMKV